MRDAYDLTEARTERLCRAIWKSADPHDFVQLGVGAIHQMHHSTGRAKAIAALVDCSTETGDRINKSETKHTRTWPLLLAGILPFLTLEGAVAYVAAATGMDEEEVDQLLRRNLGPEKAQQ